MVDGSDPFVQLEACLAAEQRRQEVVEGIVEFMCESDDMTVEIDDVEDAVRAGLDQLSSREDLDLDLRIDEVAPEIVEDIEDRYEAGDREFEMAQWLDIEGFIGDLSVTLPDVGDEYTITEEVSCNAEIIARSGEIDEVRMLDSFLDSTCTEGETGQLFDQIRQ